MVFPSRRCRVVVLVGLPVSWNTVAVAVGPACIQQLATAFRTWESVPNELESTLGAPCTAEGRSQPRGHTAAATEVAAAGMEVPWEILRVRMAPPLC